MEATDGWRISIDKPVSIYDNVFMFIQKTLECD